MIRVLLRRLVLGVGTVACVYTVTFLMVVTIPGNPLQQGERTIPPEAEAALRVRYNMDNNWAYFRQFAAGALRLDFGPTYMYPDWTCNQIIRQSLPVSFSLGLSAVVIALVVGVPLGVLAALKRDGWTDIFAQGVVMLGISIPSFVTGTVLLAVVAVHFGVAPIGGWGTLWHVPLPAVALALPLIAYIARLTRSSMMEVLGQDFVRTAVAKGLSRRAVLLRHALPVALLPVVSYLGPATAQAMTGAFVVEKVFAIPGLGQHFVNAALNRDVGLILATVLVFATLLVILNIVVDVVYLLLDPRIRNAL